MTPEELLKPRYKVIALWPFESERKMGSIYCEPNVPRGGQWMGLWSWWDEMAKHPHLFKPLQWWEERKESDMPQYVKADEGWVGKLGKPYSHNLKNCCEVTLKNGNIVVSHLDNFQPATEQEYLNTIMREIKFRFRLEMLLDEWGRYKKGDVEIFYIPLLDEQSGLARFKIDKQWKMLSCNLFTGLKDKNGKEIYEGDIIKYPASGGLDKIVQVVWNNEWARFEGDGGFGFSHAYNVEIIGNIYEHPHLLNSEQKPERSVAREDQSGNKS